MPTFVRSSFDRNKPRQHLLRLLHGCEDARIYQIPSTHYSAHAHRAKMALKIYSIAIFVRSDLVAIAAGEVKNKRH